MKTDDKTKTEENSQQAEGDSVKTDCYAHKEILDAYEQCHKEGIINGWEKVGWTEEKVFDCCMRYELETGERMSFQEIEDAIFRANDCLGAAPVRQEYYFLGYIQRENCLT